MKNLLKYFIGKICTISTIQINFRFKEEQMMDYFMGTIDSIDDEGIMTTHPITKCKNFIFFPHIVAIAEEQVLYEDNPEDIKLIEQYKTEAGKNKPPVSKFVDPAALAELAALGKNKANL